MRAGAPPRKGLRTADVAALGLALLRPPHNPGVRILVSYFVYDSEAFVLLSFVFLRYAVRSFCSLGGVVFSRWHACRMKVLFSFYISLLLVSDSP